MSSHQPNERLPFDILGLVFTHYAEEETIWRPLETLLLVCRTWSRAALGHRTLWSNFRIYLGHDDTSITWNARLPLRLDRCGSDCPLDIDIRNILDLPYEEEAPEETQSDESYIPWTCDPTIKPTDTFIECTCYGIARECAESSLYKLAGAHGNLSSRWRTLNLSLGQTYLRVAGKLLASALGHPTPCLTDLQLDHVHIGAENSDVTILPYTAKVSRLVFLDCSFPSFTTFEGVVEASVGRRIPLSDEEAITVLRTASEIQMLRLHVTTNPTVVLPMRMHALRTLHIEGFIFPLSIYTAELPQLEDISVWWVGPNPISFILDCKGIEIDKIKTMTLNPRGGFFEITSEAEYISVIDSFLELFRRAKSLTHLSAAGNLLEVILKIFWDAIKRGDSTSLFPSASASDRRARLTDLISGDSFEFEGKETTEMLEALSRQWRLKAPNLLSYSLLTLL